MNHLKYLKYLLRHKWYVFVECCKLGIVWRGITHDLSKFRPSEWFPYAAHFHGEHQGLEDDEAFDRAWKLHIKRNDHHWNHWEHAKYRMPPECVLEMLADWRGMAKTLGKPSIGPWYAANRGRIKLHVTTRYMLYMCMTPDELLDVEM